MLTCTLDKTWHPDVISILTRTKSTEMKFHPQKTVLCIRFSALHECVFFVILCFIDYSAPHPDKLLT